MSTQTEAPMSTTANDAEPQLIRGVGLWGATMLNMIDIHVRGFYFALSLPFP